MKKLKIQQQEESIIRIEDIDLNKHLVLWKGDNENYVLLRYMDGYKFKDIANNGGAIGGFKTLNEILSDVTFLKALKDGEIEIYEM